ncbi:MAG: hypothetical protein HY509_03175 [Acidobacteria bacterium]|nr:hypothetical protein [Acidobacteriota bacterium]
MFAMLPMVDPAAWNEFLRVLLVPIAWVPVMQQYLVDFFLHSDSGWIAAGKFLFLLFPLLLFVCAVWCTQLSLYTVPFRSGRIRFATSLLVAWWDAARAVWCFWVGLFRIALVTAGWVLTLARLAVQFLAEAVRRIVTAPFTMSGRISRSYFQPGVPWIAFLLLVFWCLLEGTIFTYTHLPTVTEVLADVVGMGAPRLTGVVLFLFLTLLILGSFACLQALIDTFRRHEYKFIVQMVVVEAFVMFFEVMFLYRELVDAVVPWIAQQTGEQFRLGIGFTLSVAAFGWIGIRGMTWFLFGQFGTPPLLAILSRRPMAPPEGAELTSTWTQQAAPSWRVNLQEFREEIDWLHAKSDEVLDVLTLPVLQVLGAALNFAMILLKARPAMRLPLRSAKEAMETGQALYGAGGLQAGKAEP